MSEDYYEIVIRFRRDELDLESLLERLEAAVCQHEEPRDDCFSWSMTNGAMSERDDSV